MDGWNIRKAGPLHTSFKNGTLEQALQVILLTHNIALGKLAWQQYQYRTQPWGADKAVDGLYSVRSAAGGQCTISGNQKQTATWRVDLGGVLSVHHITIYFRTDDVAWNENNGYTDHLLGFSIYISNTTNKDDGYLCFKDTNYTKATVPNTTTIECINHGQYVIYYNERLFGVTYPVGYSKYAYNELCELEVYGCPTAGFYGENCDLTCPQNCQEGHCNIVDGTCLGCLTGYKGPRCEEQCDNNKYGLECSLTCGNCSNGEQCNHMNGSCPNGCDVGAQGYRCDEGCDFGRYGKNCVEICNSNCRVCNRFTGVCELDCYAGWKGTFCENECDGRQYGHNCNQSCGSCSNFEQCHHINGTCLNGCDKGYQGEECTKECIEGRYGYNCQDLCNINCGVPGRCNRVTGQCEGGCQSGWKGSKCDNKCDGGKFGLSCAHTCGVCIEKEQCHYLNGTCLNGCGRGYQGKNCIQECAWGFHGYGCNETCSTECFNGTCDAMTGACPQVSAPDPQEINTGPIIGGAVTVIVVSLAVVVLVFVFRRTEVTDDGGYQGLGLRTEVSDNGWYQELGPRTEIYDQSKDNAAYQELGQISQLSHYDKLH
ncbi:multiple epidermal growth factor-like domains protein 10 [Saccostrea echinata]|uniref:multiple epidermal growth factor-like domains protein 10 n=1 Tax=Saccostrea echinata TaxID=191078 RepID=UPI002A804E32|nr:multiple epidermal growth factor-like domains protein 10 [Saccostrea echinata]